MESLNVRLVNVPAEDGKLLPAGPAGD